MGYQRVCTLILTACGKLHRQQEFQSQYLTPGRFETFRLVLAALVLLFGRALVWLYSKVGEAARCVCAVSQWVKAGVWSRWMSFTTGERIAVAVGGVLVLVSRVYQVGTLPISYDEAWTYLNMSSKNWLVSMSYYPAPNNHILFSILTNLTVLLPLDPTLALRLPNLLLLPVCYVTVLLVLREFFGSKVSILGTVAFMTAYPVALYGVQARGYFLYMWFAVLSVYCTYKMIHTSQRHFAFVWVLVNALGFYVMPSFLYPFASMSLFAAAVCIANKNWSRFRQVVVAGAVTGILVVCLYAPVFLVSGVSAVTSNPYVQKRTLAYVLTHAPAHFVSTGNWMLGSALPYGYLVCAAILGWLVFEGIQNAKQRMLALAALLLLISPFLIVLLHKVVPFERTWSYCVFPLVIGFCFAARRISRYVSANGFWYLATVAILFGNGFLFERTYQRNYLLDSDAHQIANLALRRGFHSFFIANDYQEVLLYYYYTTVQQPYQVDNAQVGKSFKAEAYYDCLLLNKSATRPVNIQEYRFVPVSRCVDVFEKKSAPIIQPVNRTSN